MKQLLIFFLTVGLSFNLFAQSMPSPSPSTFLDKELTELLSYLPKRDSVQVAVSSVSVAWHIDHTLKVLNAVLNSLEQSTPNNFKANINFLRGVVFMTKNMPRGVGKAPKSVLPPEDIKNEDILAQLQEVKQRFSTINALPKKASFDHPVFGLLKTKKSIKFLDIHTNHHLKIIRDILAN